MGGARGVTGTAGAAQRAAHRTVNMLVGTTSDAQALELKEEDRMAQATATKLRPLGDKVVVQPTAREETTKSGIVLPDTAKEKPQEGRIVAVGTGRVLDNGERQKLEVSEGQKVLYAKYAGTEVKLDNEEYLILSEKDILAVLED
jgi:chaperonin GroES